MLNRLLHLERLARAQSHRSDVQCDLAEARLDAGDLHGAAQALERAEAIAATTGAGFLRIARAYERMPLPNRAAQLFRRAAQVTEEAVAAHQGLGRVALASGDHAVAMVALSTAVWMAPNDPATRLMLARALLGSGRLPEAHDEVIKVLNLRPTDADAWQLRCIIADRLGNLDERLTALAGLAQVAADRLGALRRWVALLDTAGRSEEATRHLAASAVQHPELLVELARRQVAADDPAARSTLESVVRQPDCPPELFYHLGRSEQLTDQHAAAVGSFRQAVARGHTSADLCCALAWSLHRLGDYSGALSTLVQGSVTFRGDPQINAMLTRMQGSSPPQAVIEASGEQSRMMVGGLDCIAVVDFLEFLRLNRRTGTLRLTSPRGVAEIHMLEGNIASISSSNVPRLGDHLIEKGLVTRSQVDRLASDQVGIMLGRSLVDQKVLPLAAMLDALYEQATVAITEVLGWTEGQFVFRPDDALRQKIPPEFELNTARVMLDALRWMDEQAAHPAGDGD